MQIEKKLPVIFVSNEEWRESFHLFLKICAMQLSRGIKKMSRSSTKSRHAKPMQYVSASTLGRH